VVVLLRRKLALEMAFNIFTTKRVKFMCKSEHIRSDARFKAGATEDKT
jgi:hypothetical protein